MWDMPCGVWTFMTKLFRWDLKPGDPNRVFPLRIPDAILTGSLYSVHISTFLHYFTQGLTEIFTFCVNCYLQIKCCILTQLSWSRIRAKVSAASLNLWVFRRPSTRIIFFTTRKKVSIFVSRKFEDYQLFRVLLHDAASWVRSRQFLSWFRERSLKRQSASRRAQK